MPTLYYGRYCKGIKTDRYAARHCLAPPHGPVSWLMLETRNWLAGAAVSKAYIRNWLAGLKPQFLHTVTYSKLNPGLVRVVLVRVNLLFVPSPYTGRRGAAKRKAHASV